MVGAYLSWDWIGLDWIGWGWDVYNGWWICGCGGIMGMAITLLRLRGLGISMMRARVDRQFVV